MLKALVVDDQVDHHELITDMFAPDFLVLRALDTNEGLQMFTANPDLDLIIMDGQMPGDMTPPDLVRHMRRTFKGPIVACSADDRAHDGLMAAGCDLIARKPNAYRGLMAAANKARQNQTKS